MLLNSYISIVSYNGLYFNVLVGVVSEVAWRIRVVVGYDDKNGG